MVVHALIVWMNNFCKGECNDAMNSTAATTPTSNVDPEADEHFLLDVVSRENEPLAISPDRVATSWY